MWPLLIPEPMSFVVDPPPAIGEVVAAWTNNGPHGIKPTPISLRLMSLLLGGIGGFVLGLIGFFVIGGIREKHGAPIEADWFLYASPVAVSPACSPACRSCFARRES